MIRCCGGLLVVFWEMVSGGCAANTYLISDRAKGEPIFIGEEESNCWERCCCGPASACP